MKKIALITLSSLIFSLAHADLYTASENFLQFAEIATESIQNEVPGRSEIHSVELQYSKKSSKLLAIAKIINNEIEKVCTVDINDLRNPKLQGCVDLIK